MAKDLTAIALEKMKPAATRQEIPDGKVRGLYHVVQSSGARSWAFRYRARIDGRPRKLTLGSYPGTTLEAARRAAVVAMQSVAAGNDPAADKAAALKAVRTPAADHLVENVVRNFIERHAKEKTRKATWQESERILQREIVTRWRGRPLSVVRKSDIHALLDAIMDRGKPAAALRSLQAIRPMFKWAAQRGIIQTSPCEGVDAPSKPGERERWLADDELRAVWSAASSLRYPFGPIIQLLILLGQRRDEVAGMTFGELDAEKGVWTLPAARSKNKKAHVVPLPPLALSIIANLPRIESEAGFLFTTTGTSHVVGFGKAKLRLDRSLAKAGRALSPWTLHDLRRTFATGCASLSVAPQVVEAILNHSGGVIRGVAKIYNRYDHAREKRAALDLWAAHLSELISGQQNAEHEHITRGSISSGPSQGPS